MNYDINNLKINNLEQIKHDLIKNLILPDNIILTNLLVSDNEKVLSFVKWYFNYFNVLDTNCNILKTFYITSLMSHNSNKNIKENKNFIKFLLKNKSYNFLDNSFKQKIINYEIREVEKDFNKNLLKNKIDYF